MKKFLILITFVLISSCQSQKSIPSRPEAVQENASYIKPDLLVQFKAQIPDFPKINSAEQKADEAELRKLQKTRSKKDCERADSEVKVTLETFYGKPYGILNAEQLRLLNPLFDKIRSEGGPYIGQIKNSFSRPRPYLYLKDINPCIAKETSLAYPSGHATLAALYADVLTDLFPEHTAAFQKRRNEIANDRVLAGIHHRSDVKYGLVLGDLLHAEMMKSAKFRTDLENYRKTFQTVCSASLNCFDSKQ